MVEATVESYIPAAEEGNPLKHSTAEVWVSAVIDLYNVQIAKGQHSYPHPEPEGRLLEPEAPLGRLTCFPHLDS